MRESTLAQAEEYDVPCCKKCGNELEWVDCWMIDCEEGSYDLYEEDPIFYSPGDVGVCEECGGKGGWLVCQNCESSASNENEVR